VIEIVATVFERAEKHLVSMAAVGLGSVPWSIAPTAQKAETKLVAALREHVARATPAERARFVAPGPRDLVTAALELSLTGPRGRRSVAGRFPLVVETRWIGADRRAHFVHHPAQPGTWLAIDDPAALVEEARWFYSRAWSALDDDAIDALRTSGRERLRTIAFNARAKTLAEAVAERSGPAGGDRRVRGARIPLAVIPSLGVDLTQLAIAGTLPLGVARPAIDGRVDATIRDVRSPSGTAPSPMRRATASTVPCSPMSKRTSRSALP
jgi:hypothetical protein